MNLFERGKTDLALQQLCPQPLCIFGMREHEELESPLLGREEGGEGVGIVVDPCSYFLQLFVKQLVKVEGDNRVVADDAGW